MPTWVRVRDKQTGHQFDIDARALPHRPGVEPLNDPERWPDLTGPRAVPRPTKPHVSKDGRASVADRADAASDGGPVDLTKTPSTVDVPSRTRRTTTGPADTTAATNKEGNAQ